MWWCHERNRKLLKCVRKCVCRKHRRIADIPLVTLLRDNTIVRHTVLLGGSYTSAIAMQSWYPARLKCILVDYTMLCFIMLWAEIKKEGFIYLYNNNHILHHDYPRYDASLALATVMEGNAFFVGLQIMPHKYAVILNYHAWSRRT